MARRLIVNADDYGRSDGVTDGILAAQRAGIVTSATLMVAYPAAERAARLARRQPALGLGLHLALTGGPSVLPAEALPSLAAGDGHLPARPEGLVAARSEEVQAEARAQLERFRSLVGRDPTHFDSHHHAHRLPLVFEALVALALETGRPVRSASPGMGLELRRRGIPTPDAFVDRFYGEAASAGMLEGIIAGLAPGTTELMCHPAYVDPTLRSSSSYTADRERELGLLTAPGLRARIDAAGVQLVTFEALPFPVDWA
jgi:predicted glycoside hydrolase/deacetylase ChbG (UPF0249 family)